MTKAEMETLISFDRETDEMTIYTADPFLMARLGKMDAYALRQEFKQDGKTVAAEYTGHKKLLTLRSKMPRELSPEEKRKLAERFSM